MGDFAFLTESSKAELHQYVVFRLKRCLEVLWQNNFQVMSNSLSKPKHLVGLTDHLLQTKSSKLDSSGFLFIHLSLLSCCLPGG